LGLKGPAGVGKTTLVKDGLGRALGIPSAFIALGGANDSSFLDGHSYTYQGSMYGRIAEALMDTGVMNPIIVFDELDKVSENTRGAEIINTLIHITDFAQNSAFCDEYFGGGLPMDLSRCTFVFTYNDASLVNPILRNRLVEIDVPDYKSPERMKILREYVLPKALSSFGSPFASKIEDLGDEIMKHIVERHVDSPGLRGIQHDVDYLLGVINLEMSLSGFEGPIDIAAVSRILKEFARSEHVVPEGVRHMYV
jgi:ATP-dependent Lon protease